MRFNKKTEDVIVAVISPLVVMALFAALILLANKIL